MIFFYITFNVEKQKTYQDQLKQPKSAKKDSKVVQQFPCNDCSIVLNSQIQLSQHLTSQKHKDMLTQKNIKPGQVSLYLYSKPVA